MMILFQKIQKFVNPFFEKVHIHESLKKNLFAMDAFSKLGDGLFLKMMNNEIELMLYDT
jgi:hypothetical protein